MILKMIVGRGARGLLNYISRPDKTDHDHTRPVFTNMAGATPRELSAEISALRKLRPNLGRAVAHLVLSSDPRDRQLTDDEWRQAVQTALQVHGADQAAFAAYRHRDTDHDHTHVFFCEFYLAVRSFLTLTIFEKTKPLRGKLKRSLN